MAAPSLSKTGVTTVNLTKASTFPSSDPLTMNQFVGVSDDNTIRVYSLGLPKRSLNVVFEQLTPQDITDLEAFFNNSLVNWGVNSFTYTNELGEAITVRYLQPVFDPQQVSDENFALSLTFTVA